MAGYKASVLKYKPSCFMTFDGDSFFDGDGYLRYPHIHDESGNQNHGFMITSIAPVKSYALGAYSLIPRQAGLDQYSICFAPRSHDKNMPFPYDRSVVEVMHAETLNMKDEFTIMFTFNKFNNDSFFAGAVYNNQKNIYETSTQPTFKNFTRTIFRKGLTVGLQWEYYWNNPQRLNFIFPNNNFSMEIPTEFYNRIFHITMTRKKLKIGTSLFKTIDTVYIDGIIKYVKESPITSETSTAYSTSSLFIGGNLDSFDNFYLNDRQTSPLYVDQFAVYSDICLTAVQIANLYKKVFPYTDYTKRWYPKLYLRFDDGKLNPNNAIHNANIEVSASNCEFKYFGTTAQLETRITGPTRLMMPPATQFKMGGMARVSRIPTINNDYTIINSSGDWTLEFFVKFTSTKRGVIFSSQNDYFPYKGILIEANMKDGVESQGSIEVSIEKDVSISTLALDSQGNPIRYNDNKYHHIVVIRRGNQLEFWLNGNLIGKRYGNAGNMVDVGNNIYLMGMMPNKLLVDGAMTQLAYYDYAMQDHNIKAKSYFYTRMKIKGRITLQGAPHSATLRVMNHTTAELVIEGISDGNTGLYEIDVYSDDFLDVMVFDSKDSNVRYRAFGPLLAGEYTDIDEDDFI